MQKVTYFRFFDSLNDFLPVDHKNSILAYHFWGNPAIKDSIEALGIPHVEIGDILVNGEKAGAEHKIHGAENVEVYPLRPSIQVTNLAFIADVHLGKLAKNLRILGFDTVFDKGHTAGDIIDLANSENRVILTRSINLLKNNKSKQGYWVRSEEAKLQLIEVINHFCLQSKMNPFVRCLVCNGKIVNVIKKEILELLPSDTIRSFNEFFQCSSCGRVYWKGSHYDRMLSFIKDIQKKINR